MQAVQNFRDNLRAIMAERGLSLRGMAELTGKPHTYFQKILNGSITPGLDNCDQIADVLGVDLHRLLRKPKKLQKSA